MSKVTVLHTAATELLPIASGSRRKVIIQNMGANNVWCRFAGTPSEDNGILLRPSPDGDIVLDQITDELSGVLKARAETGSTFVNVEELT